jgi:hypothetical protein
MNWETFRSEILRYLKDNTPMICDLEGQDLKYDKNDIHYKIYMYIQELEEKIKK